MAYTEAVMDKMLADARAILKMIPGVEGVGFGYKQVAATTTSTLSWRVYVAQKKIKNLVPPAELIPVMFADFPTDVIEVPLHIEGPIIEPFPNCNDFEDYRPLISGATISNLVAKPDGQIARGTLGFFATINGNPDAKDNVVFVTNHHVIVGGINKISDAKQKEIFQPVRRIVNNAYAIVHHFELPTLVINDQPSDDIQPAPKNAIDTPKHELIGTVLNVGVKINHPYSYPGSANPPNHLGWYVDLASVKMNLNISRYCGSRCGTKFLPEVKDLGLEGGNQIASVAKITPAMLTALPPGTFYSVFKFGGRTKRTEGRIIDCVCSFDHRENMIWIEATGNSCRGDGMFSDEGDSGSAIINSSRQLIGLLMGGVTNKTNGVEKAVTLACHIHPVLDYLKVTPITASAPHEYMSTKGDAYGAITGDQLFALKAKLGATIEGALLLNLFEIHRAELVELVNTCRPVTVAWHRHQGPAFLNRLLANSRNPEILIPEEIAGVSLTQLFDALLPLLQTHGSPALRESLPTWAAEVRPHIQGLRSLHTVLSTSTTHSHE